ncbi:MAG: MFS transporter [Gammaproteobacteria bacterium]|nr:MFS transporter [Gammaproteobacteria bacterium]
MNRATSTLPTPLAAARRTGLSWRVAPPLISTALLYLGVGILATLLPLRFSAQGLSPSVIGLLATAEAVGFLVGCLYAHRLIAPVGLERAYAAFAGMKAVAILGLYFAADAPLLVLIRFVIGLNAAGLAVIVESWLNALVPNEQRGQVLTLYVLILGLFYGAGQLLGQSLNVRGPEFLFFAGIATTLALVPTASINVRAPSMPHKIQLRFVKALRTSPVSVLACLLNGLVLTAFTTVGPLFGERIGFGQRQIVLLMACVSLGGLFLQWPIGYLSDKVDRLYALIGLGAGTLAVTAALVTVNGHSPFLMLILLFAVFGGCSESLYAVGVAHANDRAEAVDYVALSSTLLFVWSLGGAIGPAVGSLVMELTRPNAFFVYAVVLSLAFTLFALWRLRRRRSERSSETREEFLAYPQTSPEIYAWLPYHKDDLGHGVDARRGPAAPPPTHAR